MLLVPVLSCGNCVPEITILGIVLAAEGAWVVGMGGMWRGKGTKGL